MRVEAVLALDPGEVDALQLAQAEVKLLLERLRWHDGLDLLARRSAALDQRDVAGRLVDVGPARAAVKRMRARAEAEIRLAAPIFQVVLASGGRADPSWKFRSDRSQQQARRAAA